MPAWVWLVVYIVGFGLLQVLLYRYLRSDSPRERTAPMRGDRPSVQLESPPDGVDSDDGVHCSHCGAYNESGYSYCRQCATGL
ncbi:MAG: hypothetical protein ABEH56_01955 [Salinirussus sp.]